MTTNYRMYINGEWVLAENGATFETVDPATEAVIGRVPLGSPGDVAAAVNAARQAFEHGPWAVSTPHQRATLLFAVAQRLREQVEDFARLETLDQGKPLPTARKEVLSSARYFEFYAGAADKFYGETIPLGPDYIDFTLREPLGVTAHITPWNMPLNMAARSVAAALVMGNTVVVKPAEQTPLTTLKLAEVFAELGAAPGIFNVVTGDGETTGAALSHHPDIDSLTFTGSVETGRAVMIAAAQHIKPVVLELGGKSPIVVLEDADIELAAAESIKAIYANCGQICSAGSRLVVAEKHKDHFLARLAAHAAQVRIGPGLESPDLGPLNSAEHFGRVKNYVALGVQEGAQLVFGGQRPAQFERGYFMAPTVFDAVQPAMRIAQEEIFGPVLAVQSFADEDEALAIANGVAYGLVAGVFTRNIDRALRFAKQIKAGQVYINEYYAGDETTPFGGYKQSGFGREKGLEALRNYTQVKNVAIRLR